MELKLFDRVVLAGVVFYCLIYVDEIFLHVFVTLLGTPRIEMIPFIEFVGCLSLIVVVCIPLYIIYRGYNFGALLGLVFSVALLLLYIVIDFVLHASLFMIQLYVSFYTGAHATFVMLNIGDLQTLLFFLLISGAGFGFIAAKINSRLDPTS